MVYPGGPLQTAALPQIYSQTHTLQNSVVYKACRAPGTPTENYRPRRVGTAEISVHEQEHAYLASSDNDK